MAAAIEIPGPEMGALIKARMLEVGFSKTQIGSAAPGTIATVWEIVLQEVAYRSSAALVAAQLEATQLHILADRAALKTAGVDASMIPTTLPAPVSTTPAPIIPAKA